MEPNNYGQGGAASSNSNPAADFQALLHGVRLGDPSSSQLQPLRPAAMSSLLLNPPQVLARPPPYMMFQFPPQVLAPPSSNMFQSQPQVLAAATATPDMRMPPQPHQLQAAGTGYLSPVGAYIYIPSSIHASLFGVNPPSFNAPDAATPSAATTPSRLSAAAEEYRPISLSHLSGVQSPPTLLNRSGILSPHPYTPALLRALRADACRPALTREEVRARLLHGSTEKDLVMSAVSSAHVVSLLGESDATVRRRVLACVRPIVHMVMTSRYYVFLALLQACSGRVDELKDIIGGVCNGKGFLMRFAGKEDLKRDALKELIRVVAWNPPLCQTLIHGLLRKEHLMKEREGLLVLRHCFTMLPYEDCSMIFEDTLDALDEILSSEFGWEWVVVCLENARNGELKDLEETILTRTSAFAKGKWSAYFLQHVLQHGSEQLKARTVERVAEDIVELSVDKFGSYVVEACFLSTGSLAGLQRVLGAFLDLRGDDLAVVVQGWCSNCAIQKLLAAGKDHLPIRATELARRIEALPEKVRKYKYAKLVMEIITKLFPAQPIQ